MEIGRGRRSVRRRAMWMVAVLAWTVPVLVAPAPAGAAVPEARFAPYVRYPAAFGNDAVAVADFTGDGRKDVVGKMGSHLDPAREHKLFVYAQQPDGSFREHARLATTPYAPPFVSTLAAGDLDGDGRADVAVATHVSIDVFLQRNGTLAERTAIPAQRPTRVSVVDLDGDGRADLLTSADEGVSWRRGNGDGTFGSPVLITPLHLEVEVGHLNRDSRLDVVGFREATLYVFRQAADGSFPAPTETPTIGGQDVAVGDLNGDGRDDVAMTTGGNRPSSSVVVWPQRLDGSLAPAVFTPVYDIPGPLSVVDVNGDGRKDVVALHGSWQQAGVLLQDTDGSLIAERLFGIPYSNFEGDSFVVEDLNGDRYPDITFASDGIVVLRGQAPGPPAPTPTTVPPPTTTTSTTAPPPPPGLDESTTWQVDATHSGTVSGGTARPPLVKRWDRDLGGFVSYPLVAAGKVFALVSTGYSTEGSTLLAVDAVTGKDVWGPLDLGHAATFAYGGGQVFVLNRDGVLRSFDAATGRQRWIVTWPGAPYAEHTAPPVYRDGVVYVNGPYVDGRPGVAAMSPADGRVLWHRPFDVVDAAPAVGDGTVFAASTCGARSAWRVGTGQPSWSHECVATGSGGTRTAVLAEGLLWARQLSARLPTAFDAGTGATAFTFTADASPAFDGGRGYFLSRGVLEARDPRSQEVLWGFSGDGRLSTAPIVVNGYVYVGSESGQVWALDGRTGAVAWSDNAGAPVLKASEGGYSPAYIGLAAGQGVVAVPATNHLVVYAPAAGGAGAVTGPAAPAPAPAPTRASPVARASSPGALSDEAAGFRIDAAHQATLDSGIEQPPLRKRWARDLGAPADYSVQADGRVFAAAGPRLFALDVATGSDLWGPVLLEGGASIYSVSYGDTRVFVTDQSGRARALDAATGKELWALPPPGPSSARFYAPLVHERGFVYALDADGFVHALSAATGEERWKAFAAAGNGTPPTVAGGLVMVPTCQRRAVALDALTGAKVWGDPQGCLSGYGRYSAASGGELWTEVDKRTPVALDAASGKLLRAMSGSLAVSDASRTYSLDGRALKARDRSTGFTVWTFVGDSGDLVTRPVLVNGTIYVASSSGRVWALDPASGAPMWSDDTGARIIPELSRFGVNITAGQGLVTVPASNLLVAYEPVPGPGSGFRPLAPARLLDTRSGLGAPAGKLGQGATLSLQVTGRGGVPATGVSALAVNVTVTNPTSVSYLTAWPTGRSRPYASNLNYVPNQTVANLAVVKVGDGGRIDLFNSGGSTDVVVDVAGWYASPGEPGGARYTSVEPARILDTRAGLGAPAAKVGAAATLGLQVTGRGGVPVDGVSAVVLNVTATNPTAVSYLTAWPSGQGRPLASNLNYGSGQTVPNLVVVKVGEGGRVDLFNAGGTVDLVVDVAGWFGPDGAAGGARYSPLNPYRILDTRSGLGAPAAKVQAGGAVTMAVTGRGGVPVPGVSAVVLNVTVTNATGISYLTAWPSGRDRPLASNLNFVAGQTVANLVVVKVGEGGKVDLFNAGGSVDVVVDVAGWYGT